LIVFRNLVPERRTLELKEQFWSWRVDSSRLKSREQKRVEKRREKRVLRAARKEVGGKRRQVLVSEHRAGCPRSNEASRTD